MTAILARAPLQDLPMSQAQRGSRRHSARLQQKEDDLHPLHGAATTGGGQMAASMSRVPTSAATSRKRKARYDEDDDGFKFSRVKKKKASPEPAGARPLPRVPERPLTQAQPVEKATHTQHAPSQPPARQKRRRMSFSTPQKDEQTQVRRSTRLSTDVQDERGSLPPRSPVELRPAKVRKEKGVPHKPPAPPERREEEQPPETQPAPESPGAGPLSTKIALPFADTPVISRNKAMRDRKSAKGERRSSLGLRGRRASSLIESGHSNALPHAEVEAHDFYKHIETDLVEPKRMRQLLTWCATRAMHPKPQGTSFEEASATSAARVIEEELLKDLAHTSELSDWFAREDARTAAVPLPERPNPKNTANADKIGELEEQIQKLRAQKESLEALMRPAHVSDLSPTDPSLYGNVDTQDLSEADANILTSLSVASTLPADLAARVNRVTASLEPAVDTFADGVHKVNQYRMAADSVASHVLSVCAEKLAERERAGRKAAFGVDDDRSPGRDLSGVLRGLSKARDEP